MARNKYKSYSFFLKDTKMCELDGISKHYPNTKYGIKYDNNMMLKLKYIYVPLI